MFFYFAQGRLGNQIFQYLFLKKLSKSKELYVTSGFEQFLMLFEISDRIVDINKNNFFLRNFVRILSLFLRVLSYLRLLSSYKVKRETITVNSRKYSREGTDVVFKPGLLKNIKYVFQGYFQSEVFFEAGTAKQLKIKKKYLEAAQEFLLPYRDKYKVFVHIRLGDYYKFKIYGKDVLLPMDYYKRLINWFLENRKDVVFIFLSDQPDLVEKNFTWLSNKVVSYNSMFVDFAIMTLCNGGILSPSSFSWWGSYLMQDRDIVFAPKYWLGFKSKISYHKAPLAKFMVPVEIA